MKSNHILRFLIPAFLFFNAIVFTACDKNSDPSAKDVVLGVLKNSTWRIQNVTINSVDQTSTYPGLTLQFTETTYITTNGKVVWPASGTWMFTSEDGTLIKRDDGVEVKVDVTESSLKLTLNWATTTLNSGRSNSVAGEHVFTFMK